MKTISNKINHFRVISIACILLLSTGHSFAQWQTLGSNTYYNTGNVGIGISTPVEKLVLNNLAGTRSMLQFTNTNTGVSLNKGFVVGIDGNGEGYFCQYSNNPLIFNTNSIERMRILANGNIGIGTTNVPEKLTLYSNNASQVAAQFGNSNTGTSSGDGFVVGVDANGNGMVMHRLITKYIYFGTSKSEWMRILPNGNIGIGTTTPEHKLDIVGKIRTHGVLVNTTKTADFVFDDNYRLRPLSEVEEFVTINKHLPEIAPADSMLQNGVDMGDFQIQLLQKIEELTLYMIEQEKRIEQQQKEINGLKQLIEK